MKLEQTAERWALIAIGAAVVYVALRGPSQVARDLAGAVGTVADAVGGQAVDLFNGRTDANEAQFAALVMAGMGPASAAEQDFIHSVFMGDITPPWYTINLISAVLTLGADTRDSIAVAQWCAKTIYNARNGGDPLPNTIDMGNGSGW